MANESKIFGIRANEDILEAAKVAKDALKQQLGPAATDADVLQEWIKYTNERMVEPECVEIAANVEAIKRAQDIIAANMTAIAGTYAAQADLIEEKCRKRMELLSERATNAELSLAQAREEITERDERIKSLEGELAACRDELAKKEQDIARKDQELSQMGLDQSKLERVESMIAALLAGQDGEIAKDA